jgi:hypothetical protein
MRVVLTLIGALVANLFKSPHRLEVENLFLRHQLSIALRRAPHRVHLRGCDRALLVWLTWLWPSLLGLSRVVQPETILRWHRAGFRAYWRWKSRGQPGRPKVSRELRELVRRMNKDNPLWGAPRIHGELLKLGFTIAESTVSKYMVKHRGPPSQTWRTFLRNHAEAIAAIDLCVVPTVTFEIAPRSPWQNPYVERLIGTLRRDCLDHVLIFGERHLRRILTLYSVYYNETRTHLGLGKDAPQPRPIQRCGTLLATPILSGLHNRYSRI